MRYHALLLAFIATSFLTLAQSNSALAQRNSDKTGSGKTQPTGGALAGERARIIVSTDIGGSDPDDYQSLVHLLLYADVLDIEGLIASPPHSGRLQHITEVLDAYEADYPKLVENSRRSFPTAKQLRRVSVQGATHAAPAKGWSEPTDGSRLIIERAKAKDDRPLWILAWGSMTDVAQAISRVAKNKWRGKADADELKDMNQSIRNLISLAESDLEKATALVKHIEKVNPKRALGANFVFGKTYVLCHAKQFDEAKTVIETMKQQAVKSGDWTTVASSVGILASKQLNPKGVHSVFVDSTFQKLQDTADGNFQLLLQLGSAYGMAGKNAKAIKSFESALELSPSDGLNKPIKQIIEKLKKESAKKTAKPKAD